MQPIKMYGFRVSKYNNHFRKDGTYLRNEWTSISDVGKVFNGVKLTYDEYEYTERLYLSLIKEICLSLKIAEMQVSELEDYFCNCPYPNGSKLDSVYTIIQVAQGCLREKYWCKLETPGLSFHFGYDYYLYVISPLDFKAMSDLVNKYGLFIETKESPYLT